jgi:type IV secretion system protein VirB1
MPVVFPDLAQTCAPSVATEAPATVVNLEGRFAPFNIRINSGGPLGGRPATMAEVIKGVTSLAETRHDIDFGFGGTGPEELRRSSLPIPDCFNPCLNPKATATLLDGYNCLAVKLVARSAKAEQAAQSHYGRNDLSVGGMVNVDQVRREIERLGPTMARFAIGDTGEGSRTNVVVNSSQADVVAEVAAENNPGEASAISAAPSWDVFKARRRSSVLVFQDNQLELEQSE